MQANWRHLYGRNSVEEYKHKQTEDTRCVALAEEYKGMQLEDICAAKPLLKNVAVLRNAIIGNSPYVNCQQEKSAAALRLVGLAASKNL